MTTQKKPGGYWSTTNPIPTIQNFVENLDKDKKERDKRIDEDLARQNEQQRGRHRHHRDKGTDAVAHRKGPEPKGRRKVTDPTTGKEVEIDDVDKEFMRSVKDPQLSVPNANLGFPTVCLFYYFFY